MRPGELVEVAWRRPADPAPFYRKAKVLCVMPTLVIVEYPNDGKRHCLRKEGVRPVLPGKKIMPVTQDMIAGAL